MLYNQISFVIYCILPLRRCGCFALSPGGSCPVCFSWWGRGDLLRDGRQCRGVGSSLPRGCRYGTARGEVSPKETNFFRPFVPIKLQQPLQSATWVQPSWPAAGQEPWLVRGDVSQHKNRNEMLGHRAAAMKNPHERMPLALKPTPPLCV